MLKRLNSDSNLEQFQGQFVPVKLDVNSDEYRTFRRAHPPEGTTIPRVFVIRADGETMFAKSTSLPGDQLFELLETCANNSGRILNESEIEMLTQTREKIVALQTRGNVPGAISRIKDVRKIGTPGSFGSYAKPAVEFDETVMALVEAGQKALTPISASLNSEKPEDETRVLAMLQTFLAIKERYDGLELLRPQVNEVQKTIKRNPEMRDLLKGIQAVELSYQPSSKNGIERSLANLKELVDERKSGALVERAKRAMSRLERKLKELENDASIDEGDSDKEGSRSEQK